MRVVIAWTESSPSSGDEAITNPCRPSDASTNSTSRFPKNWQIRVVCCDDYLAISGTIANGLDQSVDDERVVEVIFWLVQQSRLAILGQK